MDLPRSMGSSARVSLVDFLLNLLIEAVAEEAIAVETMNALICWYDFHGAVVIVIHHAGSAVAGIPSPPASGSAPRAAGDAGAPEQSEDDAEEEAGDVRPPGDGAEGRADIGEENLQHGPEADQQGGRHAHEFEEESKRQYQAQIGPWIEHQIGTDDAGHRTAGADDRRVGGGQGPGTGEVGKGTCKYEQDEEAAGPPLPLGGKDKK